MREFFQNRLGCFRPDALPLAEPFIELPALPGFPANRGWLTPRARRRFLNRLLQLFGGVHADAG